MTVFSRRQVLSMGATLALGIGSVHGAQRWIEGRHYFKISPPQPPPRAGTASITEVFSYGCIGCNEFLPHMRTLEKRLPPNVAVDYLHASWLPAQNWPTLQRAHITARTLGVAKKAHDAMFAAVWQTGELAAIDARTRRLKSPLPFDPGHLQALPAHCSSAGGQVSGAIQIILC